MRSALAVLCLGAVLLVGARGQASYGAAPVHVVVDGKPVLFEKPPLTRGGTFVVPLRSIFEAFGAEVKFDSATQRVRITRGEHVIELVLGAPVASVDGTLTTLQVPASEIGGEIMVPLRFAVNAVGADMKWSGATRTFDIHTTPVAAAPRGPRIEQVVHNAGEALAVGQNLHVVLTGDAGGQASFDIVGLVKGVPLKEDAPGHYVGDLPVTPALKVEKGKLLGHLVKDNQESTKEADQPVALALPSALELMPAAGSTTPADRLVVGAQFRSKVRPDSVNLVVDGSDVTKSAQITADGVTYPMAGSTAPGPHEATLVAIAQDGTYIRKSWQFTVVAGAPAPAPSPSPVPVAAPAAAQVSYVVPADGTTVQTPRPAIQVQFTQAVQPQSVLMTVDGQRIQTAVTNGNTTVSATLAADVAPGVRQAAIAATDVNGKPVSKSWTFTVGAPAAIGPPSVAVISPAPGSTVHGTFHIQGTTRPGAKVRLDLDMLSTILFVTTSGKTVHREVTADAAGHFDFLIDEKDLEKYKSFKVQLSAVDGEGHESATVRMDLKRS